VDQPVTLRFYAELIDYLSTTESREVKVAAGEDETVGSIIASCGVPLEAVELIVIDGRSVGPDQRVRPGDRVGVYPVFEAFDIRSELRLREEPLRRTRFLLDPSLEPLGRLLVVMGYEVAAWDGKTNPSEGIVLTADPHEVAHLDLDHALVLKEVEPRAQLRELADRLHLPTQTE
jgi:hypothetical protein